LLGVTYFGTIYILFLVLGLICLEGIIVGDAWKVAKASPSDYHLRWYNRWYIYAGVFLISSCTSRMVANVIRSDLVQAYRFSSGSMSPTLLEGDRILVNKFIYRTREPQRFDLVAFRYPRDPQKTFIM